MSLTAATCSSCVVLGRAAAVPLPGLDVVAVEGATVPPIAAEEGDGGGAAAIGGAGAGRGVGMGVGIGVAGARAIGAADVDATGAGARSGC